MPAGRPPKTDPGTIHFFAHDFYWAFRRLNEGNFRWAQDEEEEKRLVEEIDAQNIKLSNDQIRALVRWVRDEVAEGRLRETDKIERLRQLGVENLSQTRQWLHGNAAEQARKQIPIPGKPEVVKALLEAQKPGEVQEICKDAFVPRTMEIGGVTREVMWPNWPIPIGSMLPTYLSDYATEFIAAKSDKRFPSSGRPTSQLKQLWFLSRALAGAVFGIKFRTAINLVGSIRPEQTFEASRNAKLIRKRKKS